MSKSTAPIISSGSLLKITKGCAAKSLRKGDVVEVLYAARSEVDPRVFKVSVRKLGADRATSWYAPRPRLTRSAWSMNDGDPTHRINVRVHR